MLASTNIATLNLRVDARCFILDSYREGPYKDAITGVCKVDDVCMGSRFMINSNKSPVHQEQNASLQLNELRDFTYTV